MQSAVETVDPQRLPADGQEREYALMADAIGFAVDHADKQPTLERMAAEAGLSPHHFQRVFKRWSGISPKRFVQYVTLGRAKSALSKQASLLDTAFDVGLSGPSRLHDLFVSLEAMTPGEFKALGSALTIRYGTHETPLGKVMIAATPRGICWLSFITEGGRSSMEEFQKEWQGARLIEDHEGTAALARRAFALGTEAADKPLPLLVRGTNFQIKVWEALLKIPFGKLVTYGDIAETVCTKKAVRAVGSAVGRNNISWLIPCHRVILSSGVMHNYRWGVRQKKLLNAFEGAIGQAEVVAPT